MEHTNVVGTAPDDTSVVPQATGADAPEVEIGSLSTKSDGLHDDIEIIEHDHCVVHDEGSHSMNGTEVVHADVTDHADAMGDTNHNHEEGADVAGAAVESEATPTEIHVRTGEEQGSAVVQAASIKDEAAQFGQPDAHAEEPATHVEEPASAHDVQPAAVHTEEPVVHVEEPATPQVEEPASDHHVEPASAHIEQPAASHVEQPIANAESLAATHAEESSATHVGEPAAAHPEDPIVHVEEQAPAHPIEPASDHAEQPAAHAEQPAIHTEEPAIHTEEPAIHTEEPSVHTEEPSIHAEEPAAHAEEPAAHAEEPAAHAEEPAAHAEEPAAHAEEPAAHAEEPAAHAEEPAAHAEEPAAHAEEPSAAHAEQAAHVEGPAAHAEEPAAHVSEPAAVHAEEPTAAHVEHPAASVAEHEAPPSVQSAEPDIVEPSDHSVATPAAKEIVPVAEHAPAPAVHETVHTKEMDNGGTLDIKAVPNAEPIEDRAVPAFAPPVAHAPPPDAEATENEDPAEAYDEVDAEVAAEILDAAECGDHARLVKILETNKEAVKARNSEGQTPLHLVVKDCYVVCCKQLIKAGAELDAQDTLGQTPLHLAIYHGSLDIIDCLLESGASPMVRDNEGMNALHLSAQMGLFRVAEVLLMDMNFEDEDKDEEEEEICPKCWHAPSFSPDNELEHRPPCDHPSHLTEKRDQSKRLPVDKVGMLKAKDKLGNTPLHLTAGEPDYRSLALEFCGVLNEEAPEQALEIISMTNNQQLQPIHLAAAAGNAEVIGELLEMGADPTVLTEDGQNCFHLAVMSGQFPAVWQILQRRIVMGEYWIDFLNTLDNKGNNVMHLACKYGNDRAALELLRHRNALNVNLKNLDGETPAVIAYKEGYDYLLRVLLANGCDEADVAVARADDQAKGIVRMVKLNSCGLGPDVPPGGISYTPLICLLALLIFLGPYFFQFLERFM